MPLKLIVQLIFLGISIQEVYLFKILRHDVIIFLQKLSYYFLSSTQFSIYTFPKYHLYNYRGDSSYIRVSVFFQFFRMESGIRWISSSYDHLIFFQFRHLLVIFWYSSNFVIFQWSPDILRILSSSSDHLVFFEFCHLPVITRYSLNFVHRLMITWYSSISIIKEIVLVYNFLQDAFLKTYLGRWTIGRSGERGSGICVLPARYDDDDDLGRVGQTDRVQFPSSTWNELKKAKGHIGQNIMR